MVIVVNTLGSVRTWIYCYIDLVDLLMQSLFQGYVRTWIYCYINLVDLIMQSLFQGSVRTWIVDIVLHQPSRSCNAVFVSRFWDNVQVLYLG